MKGLIQRTLEVILGCPIPTEAFDLACLPVSSGGLGFLNPEDAHLPAALPSLLGFHESLEFSDDSLFCADWLRNFSRLLASCSCTLEFHRWFEHPSETEFRTDWSNQSFWSSQTLDARIRLCDGQLPARSRALRNLLSAPHSGEFLSVHRDPQRNHLFQPAEA